MFGHCVSWVLYLFGDQAQCILIGNAIQEMKFYSSYRITWLCIFKYPTTEIVQR